ncbi:MAG TPA: invasion associated locus B family protein [Candidatus Competibacteraceae bacterium]|nr:invasion associated locus B family protein [Candidatus Competibacteraceae bacterium]
MPKSVLSPRRTALLALLVGSLGLVHGTAHAQQPEEKKFKDWTLLCETGKDGKKRCLLSQTVKSPDGKTEVLKASVGYFSGGGAEPALVITAPLGIALRPGVGVQIDAAAPVRVPFERCHPNGCLAGMPLSPDMVSSLKKGTKMQAEIFLAPGQSRKLDVSLSGFGAGFDALPKDSGGAAAPAPGKSGGSGSGTNK